MNSVHTYPPAKSHRTMARSVRALTMPSSGGFPRQRHNVDDSDDQPEQQDTQEEQHAEDEEARKLAMSNLVNSWQERLQLISVITTFFATMEAAMLASTKPSSLVDWRNNVLLVSNASLLGALIVHVYSSVLSFLGAFLLISYKLRQATREEMIIEGIPVSNSPLRASAVGDVERGPIDLAPQRTPTSNDTQSRMRKFVKYGKATPLPARNKRSVLCSLEPPIFSTLGQFRLFKSNAPSHHLLRRTHALCVFLGGAGFILSAVGILCYSWALQPIAVSIFASACLGVALLAMFTLHI